MKKSHKDQVFVPSFFRTSRELDILAFRPPAYEKIVATLLTTFSYDILHEDSSNIRVRLAKNTDWVLLLQIMQEHIEAHETEFITQEEPHVGVFDHEVTAEEIMQELARYQEEALRLVATNISPRQKGKV